MDKKISVCGLTTEELRELIKPSGFNLRHSLSVMNFFYKSKGVVYGDIPNLPGPLKTFLNENTRTGVYPPKNEMRSADGSVKYLFRNEEQQEFETVFIPEGRRKTVCVSTQSGCRMGCSVCATARYGFYGNLSAGDIVNQVISLPQSKEVTHIVFMGMGEPMDNLENVVKACRIMTAEWGLAISKRNITVSTVGITPAIKVFLEDSGCNLSLSLFSPFAEEREKLAGVERRYPVKEIISILSGIPLTKKRRITIAYVMLKDFNDTDRHLDALKTLLAGQDLRVNLLPYHSTGADAFISSPQERMELFRHELMMAGISASVRKSRGKDISAACGLLASQLYERKGQVSFPQ